MLADGRRQEVAAFNARAIRSYSEWQQDEDGYSDDLENDVIHSYSEQIYERYIVVPKGLSAGAR